MGNLRAPPPPKPQGIQPWQAWILASAAVLVASLAFGASAFMADRAAKSANDAAIQARQAAMAAESAADLMPVCKCSERRE